MYLYFPTKKSLNIQLFSIDIDCPVKPATGQHVSTNSPCNFEYTSFPKYHMGSNFQGIKFQRCDQLWEKSTCLTFREIPFKNSHIYICSYN